MADHPTKSRAVVLLETHLVRLIANGPIQAGTGRIREQSREQ